MESDRRQRGIRLRASAPWLVIIGLGGVTIVFLALLELYHPFVGKAVSYRWPIPGYHDTKTILARHAIDITYLRDNVIQVVVGDTQGLAELESDHLRPSESNVSERSAVIAWDLQLDRWLPRMGCAPPPEGRGSPQGGHGSYRQYISVIGACRYVKYVDMKGDVSAVRIWRQDLFPHFTRYV